MTVNEKVYRYLRATLGTREADWSSKYKSYTATDILTTDMLAKLSTKEETNERSVCTHSENSRRLDLR